MLTQTRTVGKMRRITEKKKIFIIVASCVGRTRLVSLSGGHMRSGGGNVAGKSKAVGLIASDSKTGKCAY